MERIIYDFGGNCPAVVLTEDDREQLRTALKKVNVGQFAKSIGVGRSYIYDLLTNHRMELLRFAQLSKALDLQLLSKEDVDTFLGSLKERIG
tara:strand:+ start:96 stop:371 length:276 start_codon:yes stop_codon:yes gene_type:complete